MRNQFYLLIFFIYPFCFLNAQINPEVQKKLFDVEWKTLEGNTLKLQHDTLTIDGYLCIKGKYNYGEEVTWDSKLKYSDSTFHSYYIVCKEQCNDTINRLFGKFKLLNNRLIVNYKELKKTTVIMDGSFFKLQGKEITYYKQDKDIDSTIFEFNFIKTSSIYDTFHINNKGEIYYSTKGFHNSFYPRNYNLNIQDHEVFLRGVFKGKMNDSLYNELKSLILNSGFLKENISIGYRTPISDRYIPPIKLSWNNHELSIRNSDYLLSKILYLVFSGKNRFLNKIKYYGLKGNQPPKPYKNFEPINSQNHSMPTLHGLLNLQDSVRLKDTIVYIYKMIIDTTLFDEDTAYKRGDIEYFVSQKKLSVAGSKTGILYSSDRAYFIDLKNKVWNYEYQTILQTFDYDYENEYIIFRRYIKRPQNTMLGHRTEINKLPIRMPFPYNNKFFKDYNDTHPYPNWLPDNIEFQHRLVGKLKELKNEPFLKNSNNAR